MTSTHAGPDEAQLMLWQAFIECVRHSWEMAGN